MPGRWQADHPAGRLVAGSLRGAPGECADRRTHPASHVLLAPGNAGSSDAGGAGTGGPSGSDDDPAVSHLSPAALVDTIRLLESRTAESGRGEILETAEGRDRKLKS